MGKKEVSKISQLITDYEVCVTEISCLKIHLKAVQDEIDSINSDVFDGLDISSFLSDLDGLSYRLSGASVISKNVDGYLYSELKGSLTTLDCVKDIDKACDKFKKRFFDDKETKKLRGIRKDARKSAISKSKHAKEEQARDEKLASLREDMKSLESRIEIQEKKKRGLVETAELIATLKGGKCVLSCEEVCSKS